MIKLLDIVVVQNFRPAIIQSNPATEAAGPVAKFKLGGGLLSNNVSKITISDKKINLFTNGSTQLL